jgi:3-oxosteroid 1-dehydrogenase
MTSSNDPDVVILGSGAAGLAAALAAHEMGLLPLVIEKASTLGGRTVDSYGLVWVGQNHLEQAAGFSDTRDEVLGYLRFLGGGNVDDERLAAFVDCSREAIRFFREVRRAFSYRARAPRSLLRQRAGRASIRADH